jgi:hypothetical protein
MLYALWTIAGLLAMILLVLIVMLRDYNPALSTLHSGLDQLHHQLRQTVEHSRVTINSELSKQTAEITSELRDLRPKWEEHRELIDAIEKIGADGTHVGDYLRWIANKADETENHTAMIALNTDRHLPSV